MKIHSTYFWGKMLRSDALRNKIYLMSFNLTVVLSQLLNRGRHILACVRRVCSQCRCVYESSHSCWDLALKKNSMNPYASKLHYSTQQGKINNVALITSSSPVWENHRLWVAVSSVSNMKWFNLIISSKDLNVYNFLHDFWGYSETLNRR